MILFENVNNYATIIYDPSFLTSEQIKQGLQVDHLPQEEKLDNKRAVLKVDVANKKVWYEYVDDITDLTTLKDNKINELKTLCDQIIEAGFISDINGHVYRTNRDDQINMMGQKDELMDDPAIVKVPWKTEDVGYIEHTRADWLSIYKEAMQHKKTQLFKYDQLKKQVLAAQTIEEVQAVKW